MLKIAAARNDEFNQDVIYILRLGDFTTTMTTRITLSVSVMIVNISCKWLQRQLKKNLKCYCLFCGAVLPPKMLFDLAPELYFHFFDCFE